MKNYESQERSRHEVELLQQEHALKEKQIKQEMKALRDEMGCFQAKIESLEKEKKHLELQVSKVD